MKAKSKTVMHEARHKTFTKNKKSKWKPNQTKTEGID